jgi:polyhydroxybutyrate depolymerase
MKTTVTIISLSALLACLTLSAQEASQPATDITADPRLKKFDKNGDGKIDDSERQAIREFMRKRSQKAGAMTPSGKTETVGNREVTEMEYASSDGRKIPCVLSIPKGNGPFPCVVTIHGGQGNRDLAYIRTLAAPNPVSPTVSTLNEQPWAILAISYRAGEGLMSAGEQADVIAGIRFAKTLPKIDPARVGVLGGSHGGHLALVAAEKMGKEFLCVAVGSPWMTDPFVYMMGDATQPPLSQVAPAAREGIAANGKRLLNGMKTRGFSDAETRKFLADNSIEANAEKIVIPSFFITSLGDEQAPHLLVKPTIDKLKAAGRDVTVFTVEKSLHGFYWGRSVGGARIGKSEKSAIELAEEKAAREQIIAFFTKQFARADVAAVAATPPAQKVPGDAPSPGAKVAKPTVTAPVASSSSDGAPQPVAAAVGKLSAGDHERTVAVGEMKRRYVLHVPPGYDAAKATPVVIVYHGGGGNPQSMVRLTGMNAKADAAGFIAVYPYGTGALENSLLTFNGGGCCGYAMEKNIDDVGFTRALLDDLATVANVDTNRVFATGLSNGGIMAHYVASELSDRIAAIAPVGGPLMMPAPNAKRAVSVMHFHGTGDEFAPFKGGFGKGAFGGKGVTDFKSVEHTIQSWVKANGCAAESKVDPLPDKANDGMKSTRKTWSGGRDGSEVVLIEIENGGHTWPGQKPLVALLGKSTEDISANDLMWEFFQKHPLKPSKASAAAPDPGDGRKKPTPQQAAAVRKLRDRMANIPVPENLTRRTLTIGGQEREFFINIPASCAGKPSPVVFALHGGASSSGLAQHLKVDYTKLGESEGFVTVYPSGVNGWNIGSHDAYSVKRRTSDADDIGFFRAMFDALIKEGIADPKRIYVTGGSNGGVMTQFLVCNLADRIAGAGVVVATLPRAAEKDWPKPSRPVPMLVMLGTVDPMKPWAGNADQMSADETIVFWRKQNACVADGKKWDLPDRDPKDGCRIHVQCWESKAPVMFYTMEGHGHGWPMQKGRDETGTGPKTRDITAPDEFWKFFQSVAQRSSAQPTEQP